MPATCTTCNRPADDGYANEVAGERCVDEAHDAHVDGFELAGRLLARLEIEQAAEKARDLARSLDRRGGGFTRHAADALRAKAESWDRRASWIEGEAA